MHASSVFIPHIIGVKSTMPDNQTETIPATISSKVNRAKPLPYVNKGVHFGRVKIESKIIRDSCRVVFKTGIFCSFQNRNYDLGRLVNRSRGFSVMTGGATSTE